MANRASSTKRLRAADGAIFKEIDRVRINSEDDSGVVDVEWKIYCKKAGGLRYSLFGSSFG